MPMLSATEHSVLQVRRWVAPGRLYALIDACDTPSVPQRARDAVKVGGTSRAVSLYKGRAEDEMWAIAPYLFAVDTDTFDWISSSLWSEPWGCVVLSDATTEELRQHFRRFLTIRTPEGADWYFRFYDPRVLRTYLATCTAAEIADFFGPVRAFGITNPETYGVTVLSITSPARVAAPRVALVE